MSYLRNIKVMGLSLVAMLLLSGIAAANASATQPEAEGAPATFEGSGGAGKLETVAPKHTVNCAANTSKGEINSPTTVKGVKVIFTGCTATGPFGEKAPCKSVGANPEEIRTEALKGELVYAVAKSSKAFMDLKPESTEIEAPFASFTCVGFLGATEDLTVTGSVIGELTPVNVSTAKSTLTFKQKEGHQEPEEYLDPITCKPVKDVLTTHGSGFETFNLQSGIEGTETITTSKNIKIVSKEC